MEEMVFDDIAPTQVPVSIGGKKFILLEASEDSACKFKNAAVKSAKIVDGKVVGVEGAADMDSLLVSLCLCLTDEDGRVKYDKRDAPITVPLGIVRSWPSRIVKALFKKAREISHLDEGEETKEDIEKRIKSDQDKLDTLEANHLKNLLDATNPTSQ